MVETPNDTPQRPTLSLWGVRPFGEFITFQVIQGMEMVRARLVHPEISLEKLMVSPNTPLKPALSPESPLFSVLQASGDFYDGYLYSMIGYNALSLVDRLRQRFIWKDRELSVPVKQGITFGVVSSGVALSEAGLLPIQTSSEALSDIPAGIAGAAVYVAVNSGFRRLGNYMVSRMATETRTLRS